MSTKKIDRSNYKEITKGTEALSEFINKGYCLMRFDLVERTVEENAVEEIEL